MSGWIPAHERQPEESGKYLVALYHGMEYHPSSSVADWNEDRWEVYGFAGRPPIVTHWQPLPPPPEELSTP